MKTVKAVVELKEMFQENKDKELKDFYELREKVATVISITTPDQFLKLFDYVVYQNAKSIAERIIELDTKIRTVNHILRDE